MGFLVPCNDNSCTLLPNHDVLSPSLVPGLGRCILRVKYVHTRPTDDTRIF